MLLLEASTFFSPSLSLIILFILALKIIKENKMASRSRINWKNLSFLLGFNGLIALICLGLFLINFERQGLAWSAVSFIAFGGLLIPLLGVGFLLYTSLRTKDAFTRSVLVIVDRLQIKWICPIMMGISVLGSILLSLGWFSENADLLPYLLRVTPFLLWILVALMVNAGYLSFFYPGTHAVDQAIHAVILLSIFFIMVTISPFFQANPTVDSGVFFYTGQRLLAGDVPYQDVWDHKGPLIYFINALGLTLSGGSRWGVWALECLLISASYLLGYRVLKDTFNRGAAAAGSIAWLSSLLLFLNGGNFTEEYTIPLQILALGWMCVFYKRPRIRLALGIGGSAGLAFLLRPNNIGFFVVIMLLVLIEAYRVDQWRFVIRCAGWLVLGAVVVMLPFAIYFGVNGALGDLFEAMFVYNFAYSDASFMDRFDSWFFGIRKLFSSGLLLLVIGALGVGIHRQIKGKEVNRVQQAVFLLGAFGLLLEMLLSSTSGYSYEHYYLMWLVPAGICAGYLAFRITQIQINPRINILAIPVLCLVSVLGIVQTVRLMPDFSQPKTHIIDVFLDQAAEYTGDDAYILVWGAGTWINYMVEAEAPTPFNYQYPLYDPQFRTETMVAEFVMAMEEKRPVIFDTSLFNVYTVPLNPDARQDWLLENSNAEELTGMNPIFAYIDTHYVPVGLISNGGILVYAYQD
jgi:hypothetical protein